MIIGTSLRRKDTEKKQRTQGKDNTEKLRISTKNPSNQKPSTVPLGKDVITRHQLYFSQPAQFIL